MKNSISTPIAAVVASAMMALSAPAVAATMDFVVSDGSGAVASGQFTTSTTSPDEVTSMTGSVFGSFFNDATGSITYTPNPGGSEVYSPSGAFIYDDLYTPTTNPAVDNGGLLFKVGGAEYNLFSNGPSQYALYNNVGGYTDESVTLSVGVPEPATWTMMIVGFGAIGAVLRMSRRKSGAATVVD